MITFRYYFFRHIWILLVISIKESKSQKFIEANLAVCVSVNEINEILDFLLLRGFVVWWRIRLLHEFNNFLEGQKAIFIHIILVKEFCELCILLFCEPHFLSIELNIISISFFIFFLVDFEELLCCNYSQKEEEDCSNDLQLSHWVDIFFLFFL